MQHHQKGHQQCNLQTQMYRALKIHMDSKAQDRLESTAHFSFTFKNQANLRAIKKGPEGPFLSKQEDPNPLRPAWITDQESRDSLTWTRPV